MLEMIQDTRTNKEEFDSSGRNCNAEKQAFET